MEETSFDPRRRRLCPDGACVGLIGDNGRCKVCGTPAGGGAPDVAAAADGFGPADDLDETSDTDSAGATTATDATDAAFASDDTGSPGGGFDPRRRLCDDGACVGVIGANGACGACGRRPE